MLRLPHLCAKKLSTLLLPLPPLLPRRPPSANLSPALAQDSPPSRSLALALPLPQVSRANCRKPADASRNQFSAPAGGTHFLPRTTRSASLPLPEYPPVMHGAPTQANFRPPGPACWPFPRY